MPGQNLPFYLSDRNFADKISNITQIGGIETSVMDNGYARGTRIAWINTGSGFRYKIVLDRAMDVADAFYNQYGIAWQSNAGIMPHQPCSHRGADWLRTFGGGLFTTCGLSHVGGPETDEFGERGVHGLISNTPAEIESIVQPDPINGSMLMSVTGRMREAKIFGPYLEMRRTITSSLGESWLQIRDEVTNKGNTEAPHMLLYHFNFGWPLTDEGAELMYDGTMHHVNEDRDRHIFNNKRNYRICPAPMEDHKGSGEAAAYFDIEPDSDGKCYCGIYNSKIETGVLITFDKQQLPMLTNWQHWAPGEYVAGLEPGTNPPVGQAAARKNGSLLFLQPGETRTYDLKFEVLPGSSAHNTIRTRIFRNNRSI